MFSALYVFFTASTLLVLVSLLTQAELRRDERFFGSKLRAKLDDWFSTIYHIIVRRIRYVVRLTLQLSWYYSLHNTLRAILTLLVRIYDRLELSFLNNREKAKVLRLEKREIWKNNHLSEIEAHKVANALTPIQKKRLRAKKLAGE